MTSISQSGPSWSLESFQKDKSLTQLMSNYLVVS